MVDPETVVENIVCEVRDHIRRGVPTTILPDVAELFNDPFKKEILYTLSKFESPLYLDEIEFVVGSSAIGLDVDYIWLPKNINELSGSGLLDVKASSEKHYSISQLGRQVVKYLAILEKEIIRPISKEFEDSKEFNKVGLTSEDISRALIGEALKVE